MARHIAAHALCGREKWKPGVKAGMYQDIMRGLADDEPLVRAAYDAIVQTTEMAAKLIDDTFLPEGAGPAIYPMATRDDRFATALRSFTHLTTKGDGE